MVRAPLVWLGEPDPCASVKELERDDPARAELRQILHAWHELYAAEGRMSAEICKDMAEVTDVDHAEARALRDGLREIARDRDGAWSPRRLSKWLTKHVGRRADNLMLSKGDEKDHTQLWHVKPVTEQGE